NHAQKIPRVDKTVDKDCGVAEFGTLLDSKAARANREKRLPKSQIELNASDPYSATLGRFKRWRDALAERRRLKRLRNALAKKIRRRMRKPGKTAPPIPKSNTTIWRYMSH